MEIYIFVGVVSVILACMLDIVARNQTSVRTDLVAHEASDLSIQQEIRTELRALRAEVMQAMHQR